MRQEMMNELMSGLKVEKGKEKANELEDHFLVTQRLKLPFLLLQTPPNHNVSNHLQDEHPMNLRRVQNFTK